MTKLLDHAIEIIRELPADNQDEIARAMLNLADRDGEVEPITAADLPAVLRGLSQARQRRFAGDADVEAALRRFDP